MIERFNKLLDSNKYVMVMFMGDCGGSKLAEPLFKKFPLQFPDIVFAMVNNGTDHGKNLHQIYNIKGTPTYILFTNKEYRIIGKGYSSTNMKTLVRILYKTINNSNSINNFLYDNSTVINNEIDSIIREIWNIE